MVKMVKDIHAPKKPLTAYFRWMKVHRKRVVQSMPIGYSLKELTGKMGQMWAALSDEDRAVWSEKSKKEMKVYEKLVAAYKHTAKYANFQREKQAYTIEKTGKFPKDPNRPKAPSSGYFLFMADKREETKKNFPELDHKQVISKLGELWSKLSDEAKQPYVKKAETGKKKWVADIKKYEKTDEFKKYMEEKRIFIESRKPAVDKKIETTKKTNELKTKEKALEMSKKLKGTEKLKSKQSVVKEIKTGISKKSQKAPKKKKAVKSTKAKSTALVTGLKVKGPKEKISAKISSKTKKKKTSSKK